MFYRRNSTIGMKKKKLACGCYDYAFSKNRCKQHALIEDTFKRMAKDEVAEEGLQELILEADKIVSLYVRLRDSDENGNCQCYTCPAILPYAQMDCGHYVPRGCLYLRWDTTRNLRSQCKGCNQFKSGNLAIFGQKLESQKSGITEILLEESTIIYKPSRDEVRAIIHEYSMKSKELKKRLI